MKNYAVSYINFYDNDLKLRKVSVPDDADWRVICVAGLKKMKVSTLDEDSWFSDMDDDFEKAQAQMFDGDMQMDFVEI